MALIIPNAHWVPERMTDDHDQTESRASHLLPEERAVGSDDPQAQAEAILDESDLRAADREATPDTVLERRTSQDAVC
jgi:hypothetical protein